MKWIVSFILLMACNNSQTVTSESSDSSIKAIDPQGTIRDTSQYPVDSSKDSTTGLTH